MKWDIPVDKQKKKPASVQRPQAEERVEVPDFMRKKPQEEKPAKKRAKSVRKKAVSPKGADKTVSRAARPQRMAQPIPQTGEKPGKKAVHTKSHRKAKKRRRRGSRILYYALFATVTVIVLYVLSVTVLFNIDTITVSGDESADKEQIILESGIRIGDNLFRANIDAAARRVLQNHIKYDGVRVERNFPTGITIHLEPANIVAVCADRGTFYSISSGNRVIEVESTAPQYSAYPLVYGCVFDGIKQGDRLTASDTNKLEALTIVLDAIRDNALSGVTHIDISDLSTIRVFWRGQAELKFGGLDGFSYEMSCVKKLLDNNLDEDEIVIIDATLMNGTYYKRPVPELTLPGTVKEEPVVDGEELPAEGEDLPENSEENADTDE